MIGQLVLHFDFLFDILKSKRHRFSELIAAATRDQLSSILLCVRLVQKDVCVKKCKQLLSLVSNKKKFNERKIRESFFKCEGPVRVAIAIVLKKLLSETVKNVVCECEQ